MNINFNAIVRVRLTDLGRRMLMDKSNKLLPVAGLNGHIWEAPLWKVMNVYGEYIHMGMTNEECVIVDSNLEIIQM